MHTTGRAALVLMSALAGCASPRRGLAPGEWGPATATSLECARDVMTRLGYTVEAFPARQTVEGVVLLALAARGSEAAAARLVVTARLVQGVQEGTALVVRARRRLDTTDPQERHRYDRRPASLSLSDADGAGDVETILTSCTRR